MSLATTVIKQDTWQESVLPPRSNVTLEAEGLEPVAEAVAMVVATLAVAMVDSLEEAVAVVIPVAEVVEAQAAPSRSTPLAHLPRLGNPSRKPSMVLFGNGVHLAPVGSRDTTPALM